MNNKVALVTATELWTEFEKLKQELKEEMLYELKANSERKLYTRKELAKHLKVSQQTIINWSSRDILKLIFFYIQDCYICQFITTSRIK
jgi:DNA-binding XRE family transcriptional regulator